MFKTTRRQWTGLILGIALYVAFGYYWSGNGNIEEWLYRIGLTAATMIPLLFTGIYTFFGLSAGPSAKWWRQSLGTALVLAALSVVPITAPLAIVFWFYHGMLTATWLAWLEVSGPVLSALAWLRITQLWVRMRAVEKKIGG